MLNAEAVEKVFHDCLFKDDEVVDGVPIVDPIKAEGVVNSFGFHPTKLDSHKEEIEKFLAEFPAEFHQDTGGGMSFLNACVDKDGNQWGEHRNIEQLVCLGIGIGKVKYCLPRMFWSSLPGGMPYFTITK